MWRCKTKYGNTLLSYPSKEMWLEALMDEFFNPKAPLSWLAQQEDAGRSRIAAFSIWAKYPTDRKATAWLMATDADARAAGYLVG